MRASDVINKLNLGTSKDALNGNAGSPLDILLLGLHQEIIDRLGTSLVKYDAVASNRLKQSLSTVELSTQGVLSVGIEADTYWKFVNYGVNGLKVNRGAPTWGRQPPGTQTFKQAIAGWIRDKGLQPKPKQTYEQMTYAIMQGLRNNGMKARPFYSDVVNSKLTAYLSKSISEVLGKAITIQITEPKWQ